MEDSASCSAGEKSQPRLLRASPRIALPEQILEPGCSPPSTTQPASHAFSSPRQFSISAVHKTATVAPSPRPFLCFSFRFFSLHGVLFSSTTLVNLDSSPTSPQPPPFAPKGTNCQTFALSTCKYSGFLVFLGSTKLPKRPWL